MTDYAFHTVENSEGETKEILEAIKGKYGFVPNLFGYMAEAPTTLKAYIQLSELLEQTSIPGPQLQLALLTTSIENKCEFCTVAHHAMSKAYKANLQSVEALIEGGEIEDEKDRAIVNIMREIINTRGWVKEEDMNAFYAAGFAPQQYFELILVATIKTLSNYINHQTKPQANQELLNMIE